MNTEIIFKLRDACEIGDVESARQAIEAGAELNPKTAGWNSNFPFLSAAARNGHEPVVELLISKGAKLPTEEAWRLLLGSGNKNITWGPILRSINYTESRAPTGQPWGVFFATLCHQAPTFINEINSHCQDPKALWNTYGTDDTPLRAFLATGKARHVAHKILPYLKHVDAEAICEATRGDEPILAEMLAKGGNPNARSKQEGWTALHLAAEYDSLSAITTLIQAGANIEARNHGGNTPLMLCGSSAAVRLMADHGADLAANNASGKPALSLLIGGVSQRLGIVSQEDACDSLRQLLTTYKDRGQGLMCSSASGETTMHALAGVVRNHREIEVLLEMTGEPTLIDKADLIGTTPLMKCIDNGGEYKVFIECGANVDATDAQGRTALMQSVRNKFHHAVVDLLCANAKTDIVDDYGKTVMDHAIESADLRTISALRAAGARPAHYADLAPACVSSGIQQRLNHGPFTAALSSGNINMMMHLCSASEADPNFAPDQKDLKRALAIDSKNPDQCGAFLKSWIAQQAISNIRRAESSSRLSA